MPRAAQCCLSCAIQSGVPYHPPSLPWDAAWANPLDIRASCLQSALFPLVPIARIAALQSEAALRAVPLPQAPGTLTLGVASSVMGAQVPIHHACHLYALGFHQVAQVSRKFRQSGWIYIDPSLLRIARLVTCVEYYTCDQAQIQADSSVIATG